MFLLVKKNLFNVNSSNKFLLLISLHSLISYKQLRKVKLGVLEIFSSLFIIKQMQQSKLMQQLF
jgi:hypothetical protein